MMLRRLGLLALAVTTLSVMSTAAHSQEEEKPLSFTVDFGLVRTSGNSDVTTLNLTQTFEYLANKWIFSQGFGAVRSETNDSTTSSQIATYGRVDRTLGQLFSIFGELRFSRNRFAGIDRRFTEALGVSIWPLKTEKDEIRFDAGFTTVQQRSTAGIDNNYPAGLLAGYYLHTFSGQSTFTLDANFIPNFDNSDDYRLVGGAKLTAPISQMISLTLGYFVRYDNVPEPGFKSTDTILTSGLQIAL